MTFTNEQIANLEAPLNRSHVKQREQSGRKFFYVEGWHAIAEANRIFGFDAWTRETIEVKCVAERERKIGREPYIKDGWGVSYTAKVRVVVGGVVREGVGAGHGIDVDLGLAHESAIKEAETDGMKRALMTFGNPFGLALYDKEMANVADSPPEETMSDRYMAQCIAAIAGFDNAERLHAWWSSAESKKQRANMFGDGQSVDSIKHDAGYQKLLAAVTARIGELKHKEAA